MHWFVAPSSTFNFPSSGLTHELFADSVSALSELTSPELAEANNLIANSVFAFSQTGQPALAQSQTLTANSIYALSEVSSPTLGFRVFKPKISLDVKSNEILLSVNSALITGNLTWRD